MKKVDEQISVAKAEKNLQKLTSAVASRKELESKYKNIELEMKAVEETEPYSYLPTEDVTGKLQNEVCFRFELQINSDKKSRIKALFFPKSKVWVN